MADLQITCITKPNPQSQHEHITHLGNLAGGWKRAREEVITIIDAKTYSFFILDPINDKRSDVRVVRPAGQAPYLRTYADGNWNNNLLSLAQCP